jgi:PAS domain S-box-containing protein
MTALQSPEDIVKAAIDVAGKGDYALLRALDEIDTPLYVTDPDGLITYFNPACIAFAGRTPTLRQDRWCVTWKLYTQEGQTLPHEACPMATAIKEGRPVRGLWAVAERPDGTRVAFMPYPTPIVSNGELLGAVNILVDITDPAQAQALFAQAAQARRLARSVTDDETAQTLERLAVEYETKAAMLAGPKQASKPH